MAPTSPRGTPLKTPGNSSSHHRITLSEKYSPTYHKEGHLVSQTTTKRPCAHSGGALTLQ